MTPVPWIRLYVTFFDHPKTRRLRRELGTVEPILRLWTWAANCCQDGDLSEQSIDDIEESSGWRGERGRAFGAMVACGFIDRSGGSILLHGWGEKTGEGVDSLARTRARTAERVSRYRERERNGLGNPLPNGGEEREERRGEERKEEKSIGDPDPEEGAEPSEDGQPSAPSEPALLTFPCAGGKKHGPREWHLTESIRDELQEAYPAVDVMALARKALEWCRSHPGEIKTSAHMRAWIGSVWCGREQDRGGRQQQSPKGSNSEFHWPRA